MPDIFSYFSYFSGQDLFLIAFLAFLEGILSIDNALVLAMMARPLPKELQRKALTYGLWGAVVFRLASLSIITQLMRWHWVKFVGGGYLTIIAVKHFVSGDHKAPPKTKAPAKVNFWKAVLLIELMDISFAVDSILAAVALTQKFWIVFIGGMMGVIMMRFAASVFLKLLHRFPSLETTAYLLVGTIGVKLIIEGFHIPFIRFDTASNPAFWVFWGIMATFLLSGFRRR